jgi:hypothetical protein
MKSIKRKSIMMVFTLILALMIPYAMPLYNNTVQAASIKINKSKISLVVGEKDKLKVTGTTKKVAWKSSNIKIASVSSNGIVSAKKEGTTIISAKVDKKSYTCKVTVNSIESKWTKQEKLAAYGLIALRENLKNPDSLTVNKILYGAWEGTDGNEVNSVVIDYNAENSYGGSVRGYARMYVSNKSEYLTNSIQTSDIDDNKYINIATYDNMQTVKNSIKLDKKKVIDIMEYYLDKDNYTVIPPRAND